MTALCLTGTYLSSCKTEKILQGTIGGDVIDMETSQPLQGATVILNPAKDSLNTSIDGKYKFENLDPGNYNVTALKTAYETKIIPAVVVSGEDTRINFSLPGAPVPVVSDKYLDFGIDSTSKHFMISNSGKAAFTYSVTSNRNWITIYPFSGEVNDKPDTLIVTIDRFGLPNSKQKAEIYISSTNGKQVFNDTIGIYLNGVMDNDLNYYSIVTIGTQVWMAENLNVGVMVSGGNSQISYQNITKYCYDNDDRNCNIYGGLYQWHEMMQGATADTGSIGITRGICPVGWHLPTMKEWNALTSFLDVTVAGLKLKEDGTTHWKTGNTATNESGFTALPGGIWDAYKFDLITTHEYIWTTSGVDFPFYAYSTQMEYNSEKVLYKKFQGTEAMAVRCVRDQATGR